MWCFGSNWEPFAWKAGLFSLSYIPSLSIHSASHGRIRFIDFDGHLSTLPNHVSLPSLCRLLSLSRRGTWEGVPRILLAKSETERVLPVRKQLILWQLGVPCPGQRYYWGSWAFPLEPRNSHHPCHPNSLYSTTISSCPERLMGKFLLYHVFLFLSPILWLSLSSLHLVINDCIHYLWILKWSQCLPCCWKTFVLPFFVAIVRHLCIIKRRKSLTDSQREIGESSCDDH